MILALSDMHRDNLFLTQTPQAFNLKEIYHLHKTNASKYKDDDFQCIEIEKGKEGRDSDKYIAAKLLTNKFSIKL